MATPAWQTDDLEEEWIESPPSPPTLPKPLLPTETVSNPSWASINAKRGSLRALGHSARHIPPPRVSSSPTTGSPRIISGHGIGRVLSEKADNVKVGRTTDKQSLLSPPVSGDEQGGTFLVKDGVHDDRGKFLAEKGRDMFGPTALEKMFRPPSPAVDKSSPAPPSAENTIPLAQSIPLPSSTTACDPPRVDLAQARRASHPYAPANPSRLSRSVTPSTASASESFSDAAPNEDATIDWAALGNDPSKTGNAADNDAPSADALESQAQAPADASPVVSDRDFLFTFSAPVRSTSPSHSPPRAAFSSVSPFNPTEASHSTLQRGDSPKQKKPLRLFRSTYDTYTREHLSALVDSIAIEASPSPSSSSGKSSSTPSRDDGADEDENGRNAGYRNSKRMRMSRVSPVRRPAGVRDWAKEGKEMMDRIRLARADSTTSASRSISDGVAEATRSESYSHNPSSRSPSYSPQPAPLDLDQPDRPTHRSNPSTTSSSYLRRAEELMAAIRARNMSESSGEPRDYEKGSGRALSQGPSVTSSEWANDNDLGGQRDGHGNQAQDGWADQREQPYDSGSRPRLEARHPTSASSTSGPLRNFATGANIDDLNRFVSATTVATATTMSTSFVKHPGPRGSASTAGPRTIRPEEIEGIIPDRVGKMRFDRATMRWVKDNDQLAPVDELREPSNSAGSARRSRSRSEESEDVFAGMDSWGTSGSAARPPNPVTEARDLSVSSDSEDDGAVAHEGDRTRIVDEDEGFTDTDISDDDRDNEHDHGQEFAPAQSPYPGQWNEASPPGRLASDHAYSAPNMMTPRPNPSLSSPKPIRSALRHANSNPSLTPGVKKQTQWHESVTPAPGSARRSVSFSDGKKNGKIRELHPDETIETVESDMTVRLEVMIEGQRPFTGDEEFFRGQPDRSWMPSARTKRIQGVLGDMEALNLNDSTPSKSSRPSAESLVDSPDNTATDAEDFDHEADRTVMQDPSQLRSFRSRAKPSRSSDPNATSLTECSFGVSHDKLVQVITDVYGSEPYWDHLKQLDLRGKGVESVARLNEFLPKLEDVNFNENKLSYLSGIPSSVTTLHVAKNRLTGLTSVDHLLNLTFLDISQNNLDSVTQLACLVNLQELQLDGNSVKDLSGINGLSSLTRLSARKNKITKLNLRSAQWSKLRMMDMGGNRIAQVEGLTVLTSLRELNLGDNRLERLSIEGSMPALRALKISDNELDDLDLSALPKLRTLYADRNRLKGLARANGGESRIENLSLRHQSVAGLSLRWEELRTVKRLYLSGNPLMPTFFPEVQLPNLAYLEIAACSLSSWPSGMRRTLPNLEVLNGNYNYFQNLDGLAGMISLRKVSIVGSRLGGEGGKGVAKGLRGLMRLEEVDLRMNPSTLGFYLPLMLPSTHFTASTEEPMTAAQNPLPSVTLATIRPPDTPAPKRFAHKPSDSHHLDQADWAKLDGQFRRALPDEWYGKRLVYRGLVMVSLPRLRVLDGIKVEEGEKRKAEMLLRAADVQ